MSRFIGNSSLLEPPFLSLLSLAHPTVYIKFAAAQSRPFFASYHRIGSFSEDPKPSSSMMNSLEAINRFLPLSQELNPRVNFVTHESLNLHVRKLMFNLPLIVCLLDFFDDSPRLCHLRRSFSSLKGLFCQMLARLPLCFPSRTHFNFSPLVLFEAYERASNCVFHPPSLRLLSDVAFSSSDCIFPCPPFPCVLFLSNFPAS